MVVGHKILRKTLLQASDKGGRWLGRTVGDWQCWRRRRIVGKYVTRPYTLAREEQRNKKEAAHGGAWGTCCRSSFLWWIDQVTAIQVGRSLTGFESQESSSEFVAGSDRFFTKFFPKICLFLNKLSPRLLYHVIKDN